MSLTNVNTGASHTLALVAADADSVTSGFQPHQMAHYCSNLVSNGADDWYLPARAELSMLLPNVADAQRLFNMPASGGFALQYHGASTEHNSTNYRNAGIWSGSVINGNTNKWSTGNVRCVRKGPAPRCANPYGLEGQLTYNVTHEVAQYCDGARWIAIGKSGP